MRFSLVLTFSLLACEGEVGGGEPVAPEVAADAVTFGTLQDLGSFTFQTSTRDERNTRGAKTVRETAVALKWADRDNWEYTQLRDGEPTTHWLVVGAKAWAALGAGPMAPKPDPETLRSELALGWDPWAEIVSLTRGRISYGPATAEVVGGRRARRHDVALTPTATPKSTRRSVGEALQPESLTGQLWIDEALSVRVLADVVATAASPDGQRTRTLSVRLAVTDIGAAPTISPPPQAP